MERLITFNTERENFIYQLPLRAVDIILLQARMGARQGVANSASRKRDRPVDRDAFVAQAIKAGICPFGNLQPGQSMVHCPSGFPGCECADELECNQYLKDWLK